MELGHHDHYSLPKDWNPNCANGAFYCDCLVLKQDDCNLYVVGTEAYWEEMGL